MITHTIWTTQEDTVFISDRDRNGGRCSVSRADVSRDSLIVSGHSFWLSLTMRESLETSALLTEHRPPFLSLSLIKLCPLVSFKSCVLSRIRVLVILIVLLLYCSLRSVAYMSIAWVTCGTCVFLWHFLFYCDHREENESPQNKQCSVLSGRHLGEPSQSQRKHQLVSFTLCFTTR